jgi:hypothetical protein
MQNPLLVAVQAGSLKKRIYRMLDARINHEALLPEVRESVQVCAGQLNLTQHGALTAFLTSSNTSYSEKAADIIESFRL